LENGAPVESPNIEHKASIGEPGRKADIDNSLVFLKSDSGDNCDSHIEDKYDQDISNQTVKCDNDNAKSSVEPTLNISVDDAA